MKSVAERIEHYIISAITNNKYRTGDYLPSERDLAAEIGVNRCSLRTVLKAMEKDGWVRIQHGLPTQVLGFLDNCQITAASKRIKCINDDLSQSLMRGTCDAVFDIIQILLNKELQKAPEDINELLDGDGLNDLDRFMLFELFLAKELINRSNNKVYSLLMNQLLPLYELSAIQCIGISEWSVRVHYYSGIKNANKTNQENYPI